MVPNKQLSDVIFCLIKSKKYQQILNIVHLMFHETKIKEFVLKTFINGII